MVALSLNFCEDYYRVVVPVALTLSTLWSTVTKLKRLGYSRLYHLVDTCFRLHMQPLLILKGFIIAKYSRISAPFW